jgi:hypothetical protein
MMRRSRVQRCCRRTALWAPDWPIGALAGLVLVLLVVGDLPVVHDHEEPGIYNEECPLARLATTCPRASLSSTPDPALLVRAPETLPVASRGVLTAFSSASFDPRAPPSDLPLPSRAVIG